ncbi:MAG: 16S rRNA (guanine(527)-N(7))-methyltransferase RsmG [Acidimicrobiia bacterium]
MEHDPSASGGVSRETQRDLAEEWWTASQLDAVVAYVGADIDDHQRRLFHRFAAWLMAEAQPAGGLGPAEHTRLFDRHVADSIMYRLGLPDTAESVVDVGSGVGLPGIPLAILDKDRRFTLVDRSERRSTLARRCVRLLGLSNVDVVNYPVEEVTASTYSPFEAAVFRASLPIGLASRALEKVVVDEGVGLIGVSRQVDRPEIPDAHDGVAYSLTSHGSAVLDSPFWLLTMQRTPR